MAPRETPDPQPVPLTRSGPDITLAAPDQATRVASEAQEAPQRRPWTGSPAALAPTSHNGVQALLGIWQT